MTGKRYDGIFMADGRYVKNRFELEPDRLTIVLNDTACSSHNRGAYWPSTLTLCTGTRQPV